MVPKTDISHCIYLNVLVILDAISLVTFLFSQSSGITVKLYEDHLSLVVAMAIRNINISI